MAGFVFTETEIAEVQLQMGKNLRFDALTSDEINSATVRDAACDYVIREVTAGVTAESLQATVDSGGLTQLQADAYIGVQNETELDVTNFLGKGLSLPQAGQFRRSMIYRSAGLGVALVTQLIREQAAVVVQQWEEHEWQEKQAYLFQMCDSEIKRLRDSFPSDLLKSPAASYTLFAITGGY